MTRREAIPLIAAPVLAGSCADRVWIDESPPEPQRRIYVVHDDNVDPWVWDYQKDELIFKWSGVYTYVDPDNLAYRAPQELKLDRLGHVHSNELCHDVFIHDDVLARLGILHADVFGSCLRELNHGSDKRRRSILFRRSDNSEIWATA